MVAGKNAGMWHCTLVVGGKYMYGCLQGMIVLSVLLQGQMSVILAGTAAGVEVIIPTFGAMDVGMLTLLALLTCREHLFWIPSLFLGI